MIERPSHLFRLLAALSLAGAASPAAVAAPAILTACPAGKAARNCSYTGNLAIQSAIDRSADGDTVVIRAGTYRVEKPRDVAFKDYVIRAFLVIEGKSLHLVAEPGAIVDGADGPAATAMLVNRSDITLDNLTLRNLHVASDEDDVYDGHGIFIMNSTAAVSGVTLERFEKMGLSARGTSAVTAARLHIHDGHVGIWVRESAQLRLCDSVVKNNNGVGVGGAANGSIRVYNSVLEGNQLDGLYLKESAVGFATNSVIAGNVPYGIRALDNAYAQVNHSIVFGNQKEATFAQGSGRVTLGPGVQQVDPQIDRPSSAPGARPAAIEGDPEVADRSGTRLNIGLGSAAGCLRSDQT